jgi:phosphopantothenoylcysteine decarboxylase / phosphopantothenate---cysteine ligase
VREETFTTFRDLSATLQRLLKNESFDVVIQAAAVSDYSVAGIVVDGATISAGVDKLDSGHDVSIRLQPNPKLVDHLREWSANPDLRVVAFKLTRGADAAVVRAAVNTLFAHSHADYVVHNDLAEAELAGGRFPAAIWTADGSATRVETRDALAAALLQVVAAPVPAAVAAAQSNGHPPA